MVPREKISSNILICGAHRAGGFFYFHSKMLHLPAEFCFCFLMAPAMGKFFSLMAAFKVKTQFFTSFIFGFSFGFGKLRRPLPSPGVRGVLGSDGVVTRSSLFREKLHSVRGRESGAQGGAGQSGAGVDPTAPSLSFASNKFELWREGRVLIWI